MNSAFLAVFAGKPFDICLKDTSTSDVFAFNSLSGAYQYTRCKDGFIISGNGTVQNVGGILTLTDTESTRRVSAGLLTGQQTGSATIWFSVAQGVWEVFTIHDTTSLGTGTCSCSS
ncbi:MAG: hypothetical protein ACREDR_21540 [Blastocatellia bacterium]